MTVSRGVVLGLTPFAPETKPSQGSCPVGSPEAAAAVARVRAYWIAQGCKPDDRMPAPVPLPKTKPCPDCGATIKRQSQRCPACAHQAAVRKRWEKAG